MITYESDLLIIFKSDNGRDGWKPVLPADVPEWVKDPDVIGNMVKGSACMNPDSGEDWFIAIPKDIIMRAVKYTKEVLQ